MPQIKLTIGPMSLEGDQTSKGDTIMCHLYNGYRADSTDGSRSITSIPGYVEYCDLGTNGATVDGDYYSSLHDKRITVSAGRAWIIDDYAQKIELVSVMLSEGVPVSFAEDENYIYFCAKSAINRFNPASNFVDQLVDDAPINATHIAFLKGYLIVKGDDPTGLGLPGDVWYGSQVTGEFVWSVFNNMAKPDEVSAVFTTFKEIYAVGKETTEISYATTDPAAPFASNDGATQPFGTPAAYSVAFDGQSLYFLTTIGYNRRLCRLVGGREPQILSFAVDVPIDSISGVANARAWIQSWKGQTFYVLNLPAAEIFIDDQLHKGLTLVFNIKAQEWYIWYEWDETVNECKRYPADTFLFIEPQGRRFAGYQGKLWEYKETANYLGTVPIRMRIRTGYRNWGKLQRKLSRFYQYNIKRGTTGSVANPVMIHRWRSNNNAEWTEGREISMGTEGNRNVLKRSSQCGQYITRQDEFIFPDPCAVVFNSVEEDVELLP